MSFEKDVALITKLATYRLSIMFQYGQTEAIMKLRGYFENLNIL